MILYQLFELSQQDSCPSPVKVQTLLKLENHRSLTLTSMFLMSTCTLWWLRWQKPRSALCERPYLDLQINSCIEFTVGNNLLCLKVPIGCLLLSWRLTLILIVSSFSSGRAARFAPFNKLGPLVFLLGTLLLFLGFGV